MANGQQVGEQHLAAFEAWAKPKSSEDFREYVRRGILNRSDIAAECGFSRERLNTNPAIKKSLGALEDRLRVDGVLPPLKPKSSKKDKVDVAEVPVRDREATQRNADKQRLSSLEQQNASLKAKLDVASDLLKKYRHIEEFLTETGRRPR